MKNFIKPGECMTFTAPSGGVTSGKGYKIGQLFVVACADAAQATPFEGCTCGVFTLDKADSQAWTEGALIYWDNSAKVCTTTSTSNLLIGVAAAAVASTGGLVTGTVRLNGAGRADG